MEGLRRIVLVCTRILLLLLVSGRCTAITQTEVNYMARHLVVHYAVKDNVNHPNMQLTVKLRNGGENPMAAAGWSLYFSHIRVLQPKLLLEDDGNYITREGVQIGQHRLKLYHINGVLFKIEPMDGFKPIAKGQTIELQMEAQHWEVSRTDVMPNWYIAADKLEARVVESTSGQSLDFVAPFRAEDQYKRSKFDQWSPFSHTQRYDMFPDEQTADKLRIIPNVVKASFKAESMKVIRDDWVVVYDKVAKFAAKLLEKQLHMRVFERSEPKLPTFRVIDLKVNNAVVIDDPCATNKEAYTLALDTAGETVAVTGREVVGVLHGVHTLLALISHGDGVVQEGLIQDCPRFGYRGMHVDVARNFFYKETIMKLLDVMSMYKLNKFHFHVTDDEGWRLEIPGLPELTKVGGRRCHDPTGEICLVPQLGSSPSGGGSGTGYYSVQEYRQILQYAQDRSILVIPEFDMPGHAHAAINAMKVREKKTGSDEYRLTDPNDTSRYLSVQTFIDNAMDPCLNSTYAFIEKVMTEVQTMHAGIQPLTVFHFGGDETAHTAWVNSTACAGLAGRRDRQELKKMFAAGASEVAMKLGLSLGAWEDGLMSDGGANLPFNLSDLAVGEVSAYTWNNIWEWGSGNRAYRLANAGYKTVLSHATNLYFDHPNEPDPEDRGYYWATRWTNSFKTFGYMPDTVYDNIDYDRHGKKLRKADICKNDDVCTPLTKPENIVGIQGQLWSETVRTAQQFDGMVYPRLLALAERAWHKASWESAKDETARESARRPDWDSWANLVGRYELRRLDQLGVHYNILPPGVKLAESVMKVRSEFPGTPISVSDDNGKTWQRVNKEAKAYPNSVLVRSESSDGQRFSRYSRVLPGPSAGAGDRLGFAPLSLVLATLVSCGVVRGL